MVEMAHRDGSQSEAARVLTNWYAKRRDLYNEAAAHPWRDVAEDKETQALAEWISKRRQLDAEADIRRLSKASDPEDFKRRLGDWYSRRRDREAQAAEHEWRESHVSKRPQID